MVSSADPNYPKGFRDSQGIEPEPRLGLAWDLTGDGKTAVHASVGLYHNPHVNANGMDAMARNPPAQNTPSIIYGTMDTLLAAGAQGAFSNRPSDVFGIERDAKTPKSYNYSVGIQRDIGWGTVIDVTYAGFQMSNAEMATSINTVPDGARFLDVNPQNANPQNPTTAKPSEFLRPYLGYQNITIREHFGKATYNSLQVQLNRRYISGLQFAVAYTFGKTVTDGTGGNPPAYNTVRPRDVMERGAIDVDPAAQSGHQLHLGRAERQRDVEQLADARFARRLAAVRGHGIGQRRLGRWRHACRCEYLVVDDRQLQLHRWRRRGSTQRQRQWMCSSGKLRPDAWRERKLLRCVCLQPTVGTRRHRQRAGVLLPDAEDRAVQHVDLQELPVGRRKEDSVPLGGI